VKGVDKIKHTFCVQYFFSFFLSFENRAVYETMLKNICRDGQATGDNMAHARCLLDA
jgi:hypothetical protein